jgi:hypothetical protein
MWCSALPLPAAAAAGSSGGRPQQGYVLSQKQSYVRQACTAAADVQRTVLQNALAVVQECLLGSTHVVDPGSAGQDTMWVCSAWCADLHVHVSKYGTHGDICSCFQAAGFGYITHL